MGLIGEFQSLKIKANDLDDELDEMERILDKGAIGVYMKQKMGLLLNSQVICSSVKRCNVKDPKQVSNTKIADELFPDTGKTTRKGSYYDKVNKTKHFNKSSK